jgi:hypothetical protein
MRVPEPTNSSADRSLGIPPTPLRPLPSMPTLPHPSPNPAPPLTKPGPTPCHTQPHPSPHPALPFATPPYPSPNPAAPLAKPSPTPYQTQPHPFSNPAPPHATSSSAPLQTPSEHHRVAIKQQPRLGVIGVLGVLGVNRLYNVALGKFKAQPPHPPFNRRGMSTASSRDNAVSTAMLNGI